MKRIIILALALAVILGMSFSAHAKKRYVFGGGPAGGTFQVVANGIQVFPPIKNSPNFSIKAQSSAGSTENLRTVNKGRSAFGTVYAGEVFLGRNGKLAGDTNKYENVLVCGYLYGAPAQLVVRKGSGITSAKDLVGKKVGVGNAGSGAFANCERFFKHMGIWDKIERNAMGYNDAAQAFGNEQLDAFWLLTAFPSGAVIMAAQTNDIELVPVGKDAEESGYFEAYPVFGKLTIPAGTYRGVDVDTPSFFDAAPAGGQRQRPGRARLRAALRGLVRCGPGAHGRPEEDLQGHVRGGRHQGREPRGHSPASRRGQVLEGKGRPQVGRTRFTTLSTGRALARPVSKGLRACLTNRLIFKTLRHPVCTAC